MSRNSFITPLIVEVVEGGKTFKVAQHFTYLWKEMETLITVAPGFISDFASIPRFARIVIPKLGKYTKAAVIHDALYQNAAFVGSGFSLTQGEADICFLDSMKDLGVTRWKRTLMYWAVRLFGWAAWKQR